MNCLENFITYFILPSDMTEQANKPKSLKEVLNAHFPPNVDMQYVLGKVDLCDALDSILLDSKRIYRISRPFCWSHYNSDDDVSVALEWPIVEQSSDPSSSLPTPLKTPYTSPYLRLFRKDIDDHKIALVKIAFPSRKRDMHSFSELFGFVNSYVRDNPSIVTSVSLHINDHSPSYCHGPYPAGKPGLVLRFDQERTVIEGRNYELHKYCSLLFR